MDDPMTLECSLPYPKTLDKNILAIRAREMQEVVPENGVQENNVDVAASSHMMEVVGMEAAPLDLQHCTEHNGTRKHGDRKGKGSGGSSSLASPIAGGNDVRGQAQQERRKKRAKNWSAEESDVLLLHVVSQMQKNKDRRMDKRGTCSGMLSQDQWEAISQDVPERTWEECRDRMDTLKKSYGSIKKYCDANEKKFEKLVEKDFRAMEPKQSPCFKEDWYNQIRDHCPPRPKKRWSAVAEVVPSPSKTGSGFASCSLTLGNTFGERGLQHPHAGPSNVVVTTLGGSESTVAAFESTAHVSRTESEPLTKEDPPHLLLVLDNYMPSADDLEDFNDAAWIQDWLTGDRPMDDSLPEGSDWIGGPLEVEL